jgi:hypothetical protein
MTHCSFSIVVQEECLDNRKIRLDSIYDRQNIEVIM